MRGIGRLAAAALTIGFTGCGGGHSNPPADAAIDAGPPPWWQPRLGEAKNWDIQLSGTIDVSTPRLMYDLDLWSLVPSPTMLHYDDGTSVMVPAGALAGTIAQLHARTPATIVICHVETGALEMGRPDAGKFPAAAIGGAVPEIPGAQFLDISAAGRATWSSSMFKRFDLARQIGCDGVEPSHNDVGVYVGTGFTIPTEESYSWYAEVAKQGHDRNLSTGMKDADFVSGAVDSGADKFDWLMIERCGEPDGNCSAARAFTDLNKAVFAIDYDVDSDGNMQTSTTVCANQVTSRIQDGLFKDVALTASVRTECDP